MVLKEMEKVIFYLFLNPFWVPKGASFKGFWKVSSCTWAQNGSPWFQSMIVTVLSGPPSVLEKNMLDQFLTLRDPEQPHRSTHTEDAIPQCQWPIEVHVLVFVVTSKIATMKN